MTEELAAQGSLPLGREVLAAAARRSVPLERLTVLLGLDAGQFARLLNGSFPLTARLAESLAQELGASSGHWLALQDAQTSPAASAWTAEVPYYSAQALAALRRTSHVTATKANPAKLGQQLAGFFACRPTESSRLVQAAFRQSSAHAVDGHSVAVWLRLADLQARQLLETEDAPALDRVALRKLMTQLAKVGRSAPEHYLASVMQQLWAVGVVLVYQPDVAGSRLSGAAWPTGEHAVVALTLRGRRDDRFWWTLLHELAHVALGHARVVHAEQADEMAAEEAAADAEALKALLVPGWDAGLGRLSAPALQARADELKLPVGILVGQMHRNGRLPKTHLNALRRQLPDPSSLLLESLHRHPQAEVGDPARFAALVRKVEAKRDVPGLA